VIKVFGDAFHFAADVFPDRRGNLNVMTSDMQVHDANSFTGFF
jgi:hypothetical protein